MKGGRVALDFFSLCSSSHKGEHNCDAVSLRPLAYSEASTEGDEVRESRVRE